MINNELLREFIGSYFDRETAMTYMGHKDLGRNSVYLIPHKNQVLKVYGDRRRRWAAEVASLKLLQAKGLPIPKLVDHGVFKEKLYWVVMEKLEGIALSNIVEQAAPEQHKKILYDMGAFLSDFHAACKVNQFGEWDENRNKARNWKTFAAFKIEKNRRSADELLAQNFDEYKLFKAGYSKMLSLEDSLTSVNSFSVCHNDFSDRNVLVEKRGGDIKIVGLIDFELSYPGDPESDVTKMIVKNYFSKDIESFIAGYRKNSNPSANFEEKHRYYLIALCLEICSWAHDNARDFFKQAVDVLEQVV